MTSRARLITSIPYWVLVVGSLALSGVGLFIVLDRLGKLDGSLRDPAAEQVEATVNVYVGQPAAVVGGVVLAAGLIGLLLALALAAASSLIPRSDAVAVETTDETPHEDSAAETPHEDSAAETSHEGSATEASALPAQTSIPAPSAPVIAEDPDVEVPSTASAPAQATHSDPVLDTTPEDDNRV